MRSRDVTIPLVLWICAAVCAHFFFGTGGLVVGKMQDDRSELWKLSHEASNLAKQDGQTFEVSLGEPSDVTKDEPQPPPPPPPPKPDEAKPVPTAQVKPPEKVPPKPEARKPEEKKIVLLKKDEEKKPVVLPEDPLKDRRIAVRQHAKPNQADNPNAHFIADEANKVEKETVATQTSHDRDDEVPTPGGNHPGSEKQPGDSEKTRIAESDEHKGEKNRAPGEKGADFDVVHEPKIPKPEAAPTAAVTPPTEQPQRQAGTDKNPAAAPQAPGQAQPQPTPGGETPASPDVQSAPDGAWTFNPARPGGAPGTTPSPSAGAANPTLPGGKLWSLPGLGARSAPGSMNTNLAQGQIASIVGQDNLRKLREADGERRKSEHRGSWVASNFERWRSAIENYVSSVKPGNQTALNTASVPFASYLNGMHNRIHPIFADSFLGSLDTLPANHPDERPAPPHAAGDRDHQGRSPEEDGHREDQRHHRLRHRGSRRGRSRAAFRTGAERHRVRRRQRVPAVGVSPRRGVRLLHHGRASVHPEQRRAQDGRPDAAARTARTGQPHARARRPTGEPRTTRAKVFFSLCARLGRRRRWREAGRDRLGCASPS